MPVAALPLVAPGDLRLLVATSRASVEGFFGGLTLPGGRRISLTPADVAAAAVEAEPALLVQLDAAVVDVSLDPAAGAEVCAAIRELAPNLPVAALACCPHALTPWTLRNLLNAGATSVLDLSASAAELSRSLVDIAAGQSVFRLRLHGGWHSTLDLVTAPGTKADDELRLIELVAGGLPDREIGRLLYLSPHTVKHRIERLRDGLGLANRIELAAWAGRHGLYEPRDGRRGPRATRPDRAAS